MAGTSSRREPAPSDVDQGAGHDPDHVLHERVADDLERNQVRPAVPVREHVHLEHFADDDFALVPGLPKGVEVVGADEVRRRGLHRLDVEVVVDAHAPALDVLPHSFGPELPGLLPNQRVALLAAANEVAVALVGRVEARVVASVAGLRVVDDDVFGQPGIEPTGPTFRWNLDGCGKARDLAERMYARVGPAAAPHRAVLDPHLVDGLFEHPLDGPKPRLGLPAVKIRPVVPEADANTVHELWLVTHR